MLTISAPKIADQKPAIEKLSSIAATSPNIPALRTSKNKPSVIIVIGKVSINAMGRTNALTSPRRRPARINVPAPDICTPGTITEARYKPRIAIRVRKIIPFIV